MPKRVQFASAVYVVLLAFTPLSSTGQKANSVTVSSDIQTVVYCDIVPKLYEGKLIRVRGIYSSEFEKSVLSAPDCYQALTWVDFAPSHRACTKDKTQKKLDRVKWGRSVDVVFVGRLETKGHFGHMDMYGVRLLVTCVENVQPLGHFKNLPDATK